MYIPNKVNHNSPASWRLQVKYKAFINMNKKETDYTWHYLTTKIASNTPIFDYKK